MFTFFQLSIMIRCIFLTGLIVTGHVLIHNPYPLPCELIPYALFVLFSIFCVFSNVLLDAEKHEIILDDIEKNHPKQEPQSEYKRTIVS